MKRFQQWVLLWGAAWVLGPACHGQVAGGAAPPGPAGPEFIVPSATIIGMVRDPAGAPAPGVAVALYPGRYPDAPEYAEVKTDDNGRYVVILQSKQPKNPAGGLRTGRGNPADLTNCLMARDFARNLAAIQGFSGTPQNMDLNLQPGITLSGFVKDAKGAPMSNTEVNLIFLSGHSAPRLSLRPLQTDAQGAFSIPALPQGCDYYLALTNVPGYGPAGGQLLAKDAQTNRYEFPTFVLKPADRKLAGHVLGPDGKPVAGAKVNFLGAGQSVKREEPLTDASGYFAFEAVCEGLVTVTANNGSSSGNTSAQGGDTNVVVRLGIYNVNNTGYNPPQKVTGTVRDPSGAPAGGAALVLCPIQGGPLINGQTDSDGRYEFNRQTRGTVDGRYSLMARDVERGWAAMKLVDGTTTILDLSLQEGLTLSALAQDSDGGAVSSAGATVTLWGPPLGDSGWAGWTLNPQPIMADDHGRLRLTGLPRGEKYDILVEAPGHTSVPLYAEAEDTKTNFLELPPFVLSQTDREVSGLVLGVDGEPVAGIELELSAPWFSERTTSDASGHFVFAEASRGAVTIMFSPLNVNSIPAAYRGNAGEMAGYGTYYAGVQYLSYNGSAEAVGGETNVVVQLHVNTNRFLPPVRLTTSGTVFDPSGAPAPGVLISVPPLANANPPVQSDAGGKYQIGWQTMTRYSNEVYLLGRDLEHNLAAIAEMDATTTNLDLHLKPGLTLSGAARDAEGRPVTSATAQLILYSAGPGFMENRLPPTNTGAQGLFSFSVLPQGARYELHVAAAGYGSNKIAVPASETQTNQIQLPAIVLKAANRQLAGHVLGPDDQPCWGAEVSFRGEGQPAGTPSRADSHGHFVIRQICEGGLVVRASLNAGSGNPRNLEGFLWASGGDTNIVVKLGLSNGVPLLRSGGVGQVPTNRPPPAASRP